MHNGTCISLCKTDFRREYNNSTKENKRAERTAAEHAQKKRLSRHVYTGDPTTPEFNTFCRLSSALGSMLALHAIPPSDHTIRLFTMYNGSLSLRHHQRVSSVERTRLCGFAPRPRCTRPLSSRALNFPESRATKRASGTCSHIIMLLAEAGEKIRSRDLALLPRPQELIISSCKPSRRVIFPSSLCPLSAVVCFHLRRARAQRKDVPLRKRTFKSPLFRGVNRVLNTRVSRVSILEIYLHKQ